MDDIGSFVRNRNKAIQLNREILQILGGVGLYCKALKCDFHKDEIKLLGVEKGLCLRRKRLPM